VTVFKKVINSKLVVVKSVAVAPDNVLDTDMRKGWTSIPKELYSVFAPPLHQNIYITQVVRIIIPKTTSTVSLIVFIVMEGAECSMRDYLAYHSGIDVPLDVKEKMQLCSDIVAGIIHVNEAGIAHGDLKYIVLECAKPTHGLGLKISNGSLRGSGLPQKTVTQTHAGDYLRKSQKLNDFLREVSDLYNDIYKRHYETVAGGEMRDRSLRIAKRRY
jgi:hypothetical protein